MKSLIFLLIFFKMTFLLPSPEKINETTFQSIFSLTETTFTNFISENKYVFVQFYTPWSDFCRKFDPIFSKVAESFNSTSKKILFAKVDLSNESELAHNFSIKAYPTIILFNHGQPIYRELIFNVKELIKWLNRKIITAINELTHQSEISDVISRKFAVLLSFTNHDKNLFYQYNALAANYEKYDFFYTYKEIPESYFEGTERKRVLVVYKNFDDGKKILEISQNPTFQRMKEFFEEVHNPAILMLTENLLYEMTLNRLSLVLLISEKQNSPIYKIFHKVAIEKKHDIVFVQANPFIGLGLEISQRIGMQDGQTEGVFIIKFVQNGFIKYKLDRQKTQESLIQFIDDFKKDKLWPFFRSEKIPEDDDVNSLKTIVGDTYVQKVLKNDKYVFIYFYGPFSRCGNCYHTELMFEKVADLLKNEDDLFICKMNILANEHSSIEVVGLPTLRFFEKEKKSEFIDYEGALELEDVIKFLESRLDRDLGYVFEEKIRATDIDL